MTNLNQLLLNFEHKQNFKDEDFYVSNSNYFAFNLINTWPKWEKNFLNICGDNFSGKSHLRSGHLQRSLLWGNHTAYVLCLKVLILET